MHSLTMQFVTWLFSKLISQMFFTTEPTPKYDRNISFMFNSTIALHPNILFVLNVKPQFYLSPTIIIGTDK